MLPESYNQIMTLTDLRESKRLSREQVAASLGITYHGVRKIEMGSDTYVSTLERYAEAVGEPFCVVWESHRKSRLRFPLAASEIVTVS